MQIERTSVEDALTHLSRVEPRTCTEMPSFVAAPQGLETYRTPEGVVSIAFRCLDSANDRTWVVGVPFGTELRPDGHAISERVHACAVEALEQADRTAKAVFN